jgi:hypothetical protein
VSTSLILGTVGAAIGFAVGGIPGAQVGFLVGSTIGALIDPPKQEMPKLSDLKLQRASYGSNIPYIWGRGRLAGTIIDQTDLIEHEGSSGGKGGGSEPTATTYSASFMILLCRTPVFGQDAIAGLSRIWWNGRLVWDVDSGDDCPCTVYVGSEEQLPDPTFEAINGVGSQPAHRGYAYVVFTDYNLGDGGNQIGQWEFEVYTTAGDIPIRHSLFDPMQEPGSPAGSELTMSTIDRDNVITVGYVNAGPDFVQETFALDGTPGAVTTVDTVPNFRIGVANLQAYWTWYLVDVTTVGAWVQNGVLGDIYAGPNPVGGADYAAGGGAATHSSVYSETNSAVYSLSVLSGPGVGIIKWPVVDGLIDNADSASVVVDTTLNASQFTLAPSNGAMVYCGIEDGGVGVGAALREYDADLVLVRSWDNTETPATFNSAHTFTVYNGLLVYSPSGSPNKILVYRIEDPGTPFVLVGEMATADESITNSPVILLGGGPYAITAGGVIKLSNPGTVTLSTIVSDICDMTPAAGAQDVTELTDDVRWFAVANIMSAVNAISALRPVFFFDAVESGGDIVFRKYGQDYEFDIPDDDLCGSAEGGDASTPLRTIRKKETDLPRTLSIGYIDVDRDYEPSIASSPRQTTESQQDVAIEVPIGLTAAEASQAAWIIQSDEWIARETFEWSTTLKWEEVEPCDVCRVRGRIIRVLTKTVSPDGVITFTGRLSAPSIYTQTDYSDQDGFGGTFTPQDPPRPLVSTELVLLDIPVAGIYPFGFWAAMGPANDTGRWPGAELYKSTDAGVTWQKVAETSSAAVIGETAVAAGSPTYGVQLGAWTDDTVDESTLLVEFTSERSTLSSTNATGLANGQNMCALASGSGWEIACFRDAVQIDDRQWLLTGWRRGLFGTMDLTGAHVLGDQFVLLPCTNVEAPESELNVELQYKAVTYGAALANATTHLFTNTGLSTTGGEDDGGGGGYVGDLAKHFPIKHRTVTASTYTLTNGDNGYIITFLNACTVTCPSTLQRYWWAFLQAKDDVDLATSGGSPLTEIDLDGPSLSLTTDQGCLIEFDGNDYWTSRGMGAGGGGSPAGSIEIKEAGVTVVSSAASIDFSGDVDVIDLGGGDVSVEINGSIRTMDNDGGSPGVITVDATANTIVANAPLSFTDAGASVTNLTHDASGVAPSTYGDDEHYPVITVDARGHVTDVTLQTVFGMGSPSTSFGGGDSTGEALTSGSGNWSVPVGVSLVRVTLIAGGGGGGASSSAASAGGGGGSGEYAIDLMVGVTAGGTVAYSVGAGGIAGTAGGTGGTGGNTTFGPMAVLGGLGGLGGGGTRVGGRGGGSTGGIGGANASTAGSLGTAGGAVFWGGSGGGAGGNTTTTSGSAGGPAGGRVGGTAGTAGGLQAGGGGGGSTPWAEGATGGLGGAAGSSGTVNTGNGAGGGGGHASGQDGGTGGSGYILISYVA